MAIQCFSLGFSLSSLCYKCFSLFPVFSLCFSGFCLRLALHEPTKPEVGFAVHNLQHVIFLFSWSVHTVVVVAAACLVFYRLSFFRFRNTSVVVSMVLFNLFEGLLVSVSGWPSRTRELGKTETVLLEWDDEYTHVSSLELLVYF